MEKWFKFEIKVNNQIDHNFVLNILSVSDSPPKWKLSLIWYILTDEIYLIHGSINKCNVELDLEKYKVILSISAEATIRDIEKQWRYVENFQKKINEEGPLINLRERINSGCLEEKSFDSNCDQIIPSVELDKKANCVRLIVSAKTHKNILKNKNITSLIFNSQKELIGYRIKTQHTSNDETYRQQIDIAKDRLKHNSRKFKNHEDERDANLVLIDKYNPTALYKEDQKREEARQRKIKSRKKHLII